MSELSDNAAFSIARSNYRIMQVGINRFKIQYKYWFWWLDVVNMYDVPVVKYSQDEAYDFMIKRVKKEYREHGEGKLYPKQVWP